MEASHGQRYSFGPFLLDLARRELSNAGRPVRITAKVFDLLAILVTHRDRALSRTELQTRLWPDVVVEEGNLSVHVSALRKALAEGASGQGYIETLPRVGYRFAGSVRLELASARSEAAPEESEPAPVQPQVPFVGRERELARMRQLLSRADAGQPSLLLVHGEAGIGKTALLHHFLSSIASASPPHLIAVGRSLPQRGSSEAYVPFVDSLGYMFAGPHAELVARLVRERAPTWTRYISGQHAPGSTPEEIEEWAAGSAVRMLTEASEGIGAMSRELPMVVLFEDVHWADPSSVDLMRWLSEHRGRQRWLFMATARPPETELGNPDLSALLHDLRMHGAIEELTLAALDSDQIQQYLMARFGQSEMLPELTRMLAERTEGHPLLLTRAVDWLVDRGDVAPTEHGWQLTGPLASLRLEVPQSVGSMILGRLALMTPPQQRALSYASVEGPEFTSTVLARLLDTDEIELAESLAELAAVHGVIERLGDERPSVGRVLTRYRFSHVLYREFMYERIVPQRLRQLHGEVARALLDLHGPSARELSAQLATHFELAGQLGSAIEQHRQASDNARALYAQREADEHLSRVRQLQQHLPLPAH